MKDSDSPAPPAGTVEQPTGRLPGDPLRAMRALKRWVRLVVYGAVCAEWPLYYFVLDYPVRQVASSWIFGLVVATIAIEFAFAQGYKLRKQGIYPSMLAIALGTTHDFSQACQDSARLVAELLEVEKVILALNPAPDEQLTTMATHGIPPDDVPLATPLPWCQQAVKRAMESRKVVVARAGEGRPWLSSSDGHNRVAYVPLLSLDQFVGLLVLIGGRKASDLRDKTLLTTIGLAVGLTLDNLRHSTELRQVATHDELTQLFSRRHFFEQLEREMKLARRSGRPLSLLILDVDSLKLVNDTYGHNVGDAVLANLGKLLAHRLRDEDVPARIGGDEFAILMPDTDKSSALAAAARLEKALQRKPIYQDEEVQVKLSVSCGVASYPWSGEEATELMHQADASMYEAKARRREAAEGTSAPTQDTNASS